MDGMTDETTGGCVLGEIHPSRESPSSTRLTSHAAPPSVSTQSKESNPSHHDAHRALLLRQRPDTRARAAAAVVVVGGVVCSRSPDNPLAMELVQQVADLRVPVLRREKIARPARVPERDVELRQRRQVLLRDGDGCAVGFTASALARVRVERRKSETTMSAEGEVSFREGRRERGRVPRRRGAFFSVRPGVTHHHRDVSALAREMERRHVVIVALVAPEGTRPARVHHESRNLDRAPGARVVQARLPILVSRGEQRAVRLAQRARGVDVPLLARVVKALQRGGIHRPRAPRAPRARRRSGEWLSFTRPGWCTAVAIPSVGAPGRCLAAVV